MAIIGQTVHYRILAEDISKWRQQLNKHIRNSNIGTEGDYIAAIIIGIDPLNLYLLPNSEYVPPCFKYSVEEGSQSGQWQEIKPVYPVTESGLTDEFLKTFDDSEPPSKSDLEKTLLNDDSDSDNLDSGKSTSKSKKHK